MDVCQRRLDVAIRPSGERLSFANDEAGSKQLTRHLRRLSPQWMVLEATGGHEQAAADALSQAGLPVAVVHPRPVRSFARAVGELAKTDPIDAQILAPFGEAVQPPVRPRAGQPLTQIGQLVTRRSSTGGEDGGGTKSARGLPRAGPARYRGHSALLDSLSGQNGSRT
ncbi:MAG: transposase [Acidobacteriaceae bacterium]|nr:transposase [Acidobacteriaceae bacterium]